MELLAGRGERSGELLGLLLHLLRRVGGILPELGSPLEIFGRLADRVVPLLELGSQRPRALGQRLDRLAARGDRGDGLADLVRPPPGFADMGRHGADVLAQPFGLRRVRRQADELLLGGLHAGLELPVALLQPRGQRAEIGHAAEQIVHELAPQLESRDRLARQLRLLLDHVHGRGDLVELGDLVLQLGHRLLDAGQPRAGLGLGLPHARDLVVGELGLLERVLDQRVRPAQLGQIA